MTETFQTSETYLALLNHEPTYLLACKYVAFCEKKVWRKPTYTGFLNYSRLSSDYVPYNNFKFSDSRIQRKELTNLLMEWGK